MAYNNCASNDENYCQANDYASETLWTICLANSWVVHIVEKKIRFIIMNKRHENKTSDSLRSLSLGNK